MIEEGVLDQQDLNNLYYLFAEPLFIYPQPYELKKNELNFIKALDRSSLSGINSISDNDFVLEEKELQGLKQFCQESVEVYVYEILKVERNIKFYITQSWCNYNRTNEYHHQHIHNNSIISGVFYIQTDGTRIQFHKGRTSFPIKMIFSEQNDLNSDILYFKTEVNRLFLYPSTLEHSVPKNQSDKDRISLAFNTFIKGSVGCNQRKDGLILK